MRHTNEIKLIREMINKLSKEDLKYRNEIIEYRYIDKGNSGLPFDIYIDDGYAYVHNKHVLWLFVVIDDELLIPVTISDTPKILYTNISIEDKEVIINNVFTFIIRYKDYLRDIADDKLDSSEFLDIITNKQYIAENKIMLSEMARIRKNITGLPCDIYIDSGKIHSHHEDSPHIKFPPNGDAKISTDFVSMSISEDPDFFPCNKEKYDKIVKSKLKREIQNYIRLHLNDFLLQFEGKISVEELIERLAHNK